MEITSEKSADIRISDPSSTRQARPEPDLVSALEQGIRLQATVLESKGLFSMIDIGEGQILRARSNSPLTQGASVQLEVTDPGNPVQVRLVSTITQDQNQQNGQAQALNREMLNMRAKLSALHSVFSTRSITSPAREHNVEAGASSEGRKTDKILSTLLKDIQQGAEADPAKTRTMNVLLQPSPSSGRNMLEDIVAAFKIIDRGPATKPADSEYVPPKTGSQPPTGQMAASSQPQELPSPKLPQAAAYTASDNRPAETGQVAADGTQTNTSSSSPKNADFTPLFRTPGTSIKTGTAGVEIPTPKATSDTPQGNIRQQTAGRGSTEPQDTQAVRVSARASSPAPEPVSTRPQTQAPSQGHGIPAAPTKDTAEHVRPAPFEHLAGAGHKHTANVEKQTQDAPIKGSGPHQQNTVSSRPNTTQGRATVRTDSNTGPEPHENTAQKSSTQASQVDLPPSNSRPSGTAGSPVRHEEFIPPVEARPVQVPTGPHDDQAQKLQTVTSRPEESPEGPKHSPAPTTAPHRNGSPLAAPSDDRPLPAHVHADSTAGRRNDSIQDQQAAQHHAPAQQADRTAPHETGMVRFFNALASHGQSLHQYQQQVQDFLNTPFFMVPLWFENSQGHGHWSWWKEEGQQDSDGSKETEHLAFDLELTGLGRVNMHLLRQDHSLSLHAAAPRDVLPILRAGMQELKERMESIGFSFKVADIFPIEEADSTELLSPIPPTGSMPDSSVSIIA